jgi:ATP-binding cassette, subfamily B, bacterial
LNWFRDDGLATLKTATCSEWALYKRVLAQIRPYWIHLLGIFLLGLLSIPLALLAPLPLKIAVDSVIGTQPLPPLLNRLAMDASASSIWPLTLVLGLSLSIALLSQLRGLALWLLSSYAGERLIFQFRDRLFAHLERLSVAYHETRGTADSMYRLQQDAAAIKNIPIDGIIPFVTASCMFVGMVSVMSMIDWQLALVALAVSPLLFILTRVSGSRLRSAWSDVKKTEALTIGIIQEVFGAFRVVKAFGQEPQEHARFVQQAYLWVRGHNRLAKIGSGFDCSISLVLACGTAAALFIGVRHVQTGALTLGEFLLVMAYLSQLYGPLETVTKKVAELQASLAGVERAFLVLDERPEIVERPNASPLRRAAGAVSFQHVSFGYNDDRPILDDVSFTIAPGTRVGIVGTTGAGKTTLLNLLTRLYDPTGGRILLDGTDLRDYRLADLRRQYAMVLQEPVLFSGSVEDNIRYGSPGSTFQEVVAAAKAAHAHDFITRLRDGYGAAVGSRGATLSGGERQRISLARAFLRDAPILILDEPTSSVDMRTEASIVDDLESLMQDRTTFLITHRLSALRVCDMHMKMEGGGITVIEPLNIPFLQEPVLA